MARYRIAFAREWVLGRWGYLDRFFHELGGRQTDPSGLQNAWVVEYRGNPRRLGRELAMALNIQTADYRQFGPIFEIEEIPGPPPAPPQAQPQASAQTPPEAAERATSSSFGAGSAAEAHGHAAAQAAAAQSAAAAMRSRPSWVEDGDVEDVELEPVPDAYPESDGPAINAEDGAAAADEGEPAMDPAEKAQARVDDLFRIRSRSGPIGRNRSEAISSATRRKPAPLRPTPE
jgi:hypothetical protein